MSWEGQTEPKVETKEIVEAKVEAPEVKEEPIVEAKTEVEAPKEEPKLVPQEIVGKALKAQREKYKERQVDSDQKIRMLEEKVKRFEEQNPIVEESNEDDAKITQKVTEEFLRRQDAYGREKYGPDYQDSLELVAMQNDHLLNQKIQSAANPADTLIREARRIAEEIQLGATPEERERKKEALMEEKIRKKLESELAAKLKAKTNQPSDVQNVRTAGGETRPVASRDTWNSGRSSLPK